MPPYRQWPYRGLLADGFACSLRGDDAYEVWRLACAVGEALRDKVFLWLWLFDAVERRRGG
jgi:hypothetical protein